MSTRKTSTLLTPNTDPELAASQHLFSGNAESLNSSTIVGLVPSFTFLALPKCIEKTVSVLLLTASEFSTMAESVLLAVVSCEADPESADSADPAGVSGDVVEHR